MADTTLEQAIADAATEIETGKKPVAGGGEEIPEVTIEGEPGEEHDSEDPAEPEVSDEEKAESLRLYKALKNPQTANAVIAALAQQAGLLGKTESKTEEKKAARDVKAILGEALGEYKFLADKLGPAIETILAQEREENETRFAVQEQYRVEQEVVTATDELSRETKGESRKLEARMNELAQEIPIGQQTVKTYTRRLYTIAAGERQKISPARVADQVRRNAADATSRLQGTRGTEKQAEAPKGKMNINQAVEWALNSLSGGKK